MTTKGILKINKIFEFYKWKHIPILYLNMNQKEIILQTMDGKKKEMQKTSVVCLNNAYVYSLRILNLHTVTP